MFQEKQMLLFSAAQESGIVRNGKALKNAWRPTVRASLEAILQATLELLRLTTEKPRGAQRRIGIGRAEAPNAEEQRLSVDPFAASFAVQKTSHALQQFLPCQQQSHQNLNFLSFVK